MYGLTKYKIKVRQKRKSEVDKTTEQEIRREKVNALF